jgi:hypothetical protein
MNLARRTLTVGVKEHRESEPAKAFGNFRGELMAGDDLDVLAGERLS